MNHHPFSPLPACGLLLAVLLSVGWSAPAQAAPAIPPAAEQAYQTAGERYLDQDLVAARRHYETALREGLVHPELFYNLGTLHLALDELGPAIYRLEQAHLLAPWDPDVAANLALAREKAGLPTEEPFPAPLLDLVSTPQADALLLGGNLLLFGGLLLRRRLRRYRAVLAGLAALGAVVLLVAAPLAVGRRALLESPDRAVVLEEVSGHTGPEELFPTAVRLTAGQPVVIESEREQWCEVRAANGQAGWVPRETLGRLVPLAGP